MFNVFLPKLLETSPTSALKPKTLEESLWDVVIFTIGGCPGAIVSPLALWFSVFSDGCSPAGRLLGRPARYWPKVVFGREYIHYSILLCHLHLCSVLLGCATDYGWN